MPPEVPTHQDNRDLVSFPPLSALLILPMRKPEPKRTVWASFLCDMGYLLPAFGTGLGYLLMSGEAPLAGASLLTVCPILLILRIHQTYVARRKRKRMAELEQRYREYRSELENQWRNRHKED